MLNIWTQDLQPLLKYDNSFLTVKEPYKLFLTH